MQNNSVAGSERLGYAVSGLHCSEDSQNWSGNVAHGVLIGKQYGDYCLKSQY